MINQSNPTIPIDPVSDARILTLCEEITNNLCLIRILESKVLELEGRIKSLEGWREHERRNAAYAQTLRQSLRFGSD